MVTPVTRLSPETMSSHPTMATPTPPIRPWPAAYIASPTQPALASYTASSKVGQRMTRPEGREAGCGQQDQPEHKRGDAPHPHGRPADTELQDQTRRHGQQGQRQQESQTAQHRS